jgi:putative ABC transport system ATP-binding protein
MTPIIQVKGVHRSYRVGGQTVHAVRGISLDILPHQITAIVGRSGSGKTTLLNLIAGLDQPDEGEIWFDNTRLDQLPEPDLLALRRSQFGFVFQTFGLLPLLNAAENVSVPLRMRRMARAERETRVEQALEWVELRERARHRPYEMSGGEQQRVSIARALVTQPRVILADEPTGQLDTRTGLKIIDLLRRAVAEQNVTVVIVTHDPKVMNAADMVHELHDGQLIDSRSIAVQ